MLIFVEISTFSYKAIFILYRLTLAPARKQAYQIGVLFTHKNDFCNEKKLRRAAPNSLEIG